MSPKPHFLQNIDVIIPALNEEASLPLVLKDLPDVRNVYVVDNGSTDATAAVAEQGGAIVLREPQKGYGSACLRGMEEIHRRTRNGETPPEIVVFVDADYSDHVHLLSDLAQPIADNQADFVLGSRLLGQREKGAMPAQSVWGNRLACFLMKLLFNAHYTDLGPFRAIRYESLCQLAMSDQNFGWTIEMQIKARRAGLRSMERPVPYRVRVGVSKISGTVGGSLKAGYKILYTIAKYGFRSQNRLSSNYARIAASKTGDETTTAEKAIA